MSNVHQLKVVGRGSETRLQMSGQSEKKLLKLIQHLFVHVPSMDGIIIDVKIKQHLSFM